MAKRKSRRRRNRIGKYLWIIAGIPVAITSGMAVFMLILAKQESIITKPDELLVTCMSYIQEKKYEEMYQMLDVESSGQISEEDFVKRNSAIYERVEIQNMTTAIISYPDLSGTILHGQSKGFRYASKKRGNLRQKWACDCRRECCIFCFRNRFRVG